MPRGLSQRAELAGGRAGHDSGQRADADTVARSASIPTATAALTAITTASPEWLSENCGPEQPRSTGRPAPRSHRGQRSRPNSSWPGGSPV